MHKMVNELQAASCGFAQYPVSNIDELVKSQKAPVIVIPVKLVLDSDRGTGIQENESRHGGRLPLSRE